MVQLDPRIRIEWRYAEGAMMTADSEVCAIEAPAPSGAAEKAVMGAGLAPSAGELNATVGTAIVTAATAIVLDLAGPVFRAPGGPRGPNAARALCKERLHD